MWHDHPFIQRNNAAEQKEGTGRWKKKFKTGVGGRQCRGGGGKKKGEGGGGGGAGGGGGG